MKASPFLAAYAIVMLVLGIAMLAVPGPAIALSYLTLEPNPSVNLVMRFWGALAGAFGFLIWVARDEQALLMRRRILASVLAYESLAFLLNVYGALAGIGGAVTWGAVAVIHLLFASGAGYLLIAGEPAPAATDDWG